LKYKRTIGFSISIYFQLFQLISIFDGAVPEYATRNPMFTLGINSVYHDSSACLVEDGRVLAAAEEERFTGIKHGKRPVPFSAYELPFHAIHFCLRRAGLTLREIDHIAYSYDPEIFSPGLHAQLTTGGDPRESPPAGQAGPWESPCGTTEDPSESLRQAGPRESPRGMIHLPLAHQADAGADGASVWDPLFFLFIEHAPHMLVDAAPHSLKALFPKDHKFQWHYVGHHLSHAASAFFPSPFDRAAVMTIDGRGEKSTTSFFHGRGLSLELLDEVRMPHSLGLLYEAVTGYLGFLHSSDEYKVMALASYGRPVFLSDFRRLIHLEGGGRYRVSIPDFEPLFGPARKPGDPFLQKHFDIAHALQKVLEETVLASCRWLYEETREKHLCLAGGVALNCVMNARLKALSPFERIWVQPAANDAGTSLGAALWIDSRLPPTPLPSVVPQGLSHGDSLRSPSVAPQGLSSVGGVGGRAYQMDHAYLGPDYTDEEIGQFLQWSKTPYRRLDHVAAATAKLLSADKIIGWFQGRMEFGPRALGARSILASPLHASMQQRLNEIKDREDFRPVAPVVLEEEADHWFLNASVSPFMLFVYDVRPERKAFIPAVCHTDGTARIQTVREDQNPLYYRLIQEFQTLTSVPVLINTSFNTRGKPIVCSPRDAVECFWSSPLDALVIGNFLLEKTR
jgi:carbamoyltransferase